MLQITTCNILESFVSWKRPPRWRTFTDYLRLRRETPAATAPLRSYSQEPHAGPLSSTRDFAPGSATPLSSGEPLALRAPAWSMKHMPPTSSPIRPDGVLANHVGKPVISADHSPISRPDKPSAVPGVQPLDAESPYAVARPST